MVCPSSAQCLFFLLLTSQVVPVRARRAGIPFDFRHSSRREFRGPCVDTLLMGIKSADRLAVRGSCVASTPDLSAFPLHWDFRLEEKRQQYCQESDNTKGGRWNPQG